MHIFIYFLKKKKSCIVTKKKKTINTMRVIFVRPSQLSTRQFSTVFAFIIDIEVFKYERLLKRTDTNKQRGLMQCKKKEKAFISVNPNCNVGLCSKTVILMWSIWWRCGTGQEGGGALSFVCLCVFRATLALQNCF